MALELKNTQRRGQRVLNSARTRVFGVENSRGMRVRTGAQRQGGCFVDDAYSVVNKRIIRLVGRLLFGMAFRLSMCLHGHRWWCLWRCLLRCVFEAWRKGVASAQRFDLTSEEVKGFGFFVTCCPLLIPLGFSLRGGSQRAAETEGGPATQKTGGEALRCCRRFVGRRRGERKERKDKERLREVFPRVRTLAHYFRGGGDAHLDNAAKESQEQFVTRLRM